MSQEFKIKFDEMKDNNPSKKEQAADSGEKYSASSYARNIIFEWPEGRKKFFSYNYLVSAEYLPEDKLIKLDFTTDIVSIKGLRLHLLFDELTQHLPRLILCKDERYNTIDD